MGGVEVDRVGFEPAKTSLNLTGDLRRSETAGRILVGKADLGPHEHAVPTRRAGISVLTHICGIDERLQPRRNLAITPGAQAGPNARGTLLNRAAGARSPVLVMRLFGATDDVVRAVHSSAELARDPSPRSLTGGRCHQ